jgi:hypothetical protein
VRIFPSIWMPKTCKKYFEGHDPLALEDLPKLLAGRQVKQTVYFSGHSSAREALLCAALDQALRSLSIYRNALAQVLRS